MKVIIKLHNKVEIIEPKIIDSISFLLFSTLGIDSNTE